MKCAIYVRESSADTNKAPPIGEQLDRGRAYARLNGYEVVNEYVDNGYSGGDWNRPAWQQSIKDARRHLFQFLWVWNQDRIARDTEQFLWYYRNLKEAGVQRVYSDTEGYIDMETAGNKLKHTVMAAAAETFRLLTSDKVKKAYEHKTREAKEKGIRLEWGRKAVPLNMERIIELRATGLGYRSIAKALGSYKLTNGKVLPYNYQTIRKVLINPPQNPPSKMQVESGMLENNPID